MTTQSNDDKINNTKIPVHKDKIPTEFTEEQTQRVVRKQHRISGEARDKTIYDFLYTAKEAVARVLKDLDFPTNKPNNSTHRT